MPIVRANRSAQCSVFEVTDYLPAFKAATMLSRTGRGSFGRRASRSLCFASDQPAFTFEKSERVWVIW